MRESRLLAVAASAIIAVVFYNLVWAIYPSCSWCKLQPSIVWFLLAICFAPILIVLWSLLPYQRSHAYIWVHRALIAHAVACGAVVVLSWVGLTEAIHGFLGTLALTADGLVIGLSPPRVAPKRVLSFYARSVALGVTATIFVLITWSFSNALLVSGQATALANGRPYCLQVASNGVGRYTEVKSLHGLSGLRMQTPFTNGGGSSDFQFAFHGVLVIEDSAALQYFNWSYRQARFETISEKTLRALYLLRPSCTPRQRFAEQLAWAATD
jgi:hypothetical protein